ncbi:ankyrin 1 [Apiospora phragmitis]|uniref:Ankyrin 1 n=1 Tax=Apiospora phragmitis TaxID=2905665 RepID=A0ABR1T4C9_9PEZI
MEVIASITTVIGLFESAWKVKRMWDDFKDAPKDVQKIVAECEVVGQMLKVLRNTMQGKLGTLGEYKPAALEDIQPLVDHALGNLKATVKETRKELDKVSKRAGGSVRDRAKFFVRKESTFEPLLDEMKGQEARIGVVVAIINGVQYPTKTPKELEQNLLAVLEADDASALADLLEAGASSECILNDRRDRPLHLVARKGSLRALQVLLEHHVSVDEANVNNATPLIAALDNHQVETSLALLAAGARSRTRTRTHKTPLHYAAWGNLLKPVQRLLAAGADVNARDDQGKTPLHMAVQPVKNGKSLGLDSKVLEELLKHGADPTLDMWGSGLTSLHILAEAGKSTELESLARKARSLDLFLSAGHALPCATPLLLTAYHGHHISVQKLLECRANPNTSLPAQTRLPTALWAAFVQKKYGSARKLLDQGADPDYRLGQMFGGISLLHHAASIGDTKAMDRLLKCKASVDIQSSKQVTPLMTAVAANQVEAAKLLVENGASLNTAYKHYNNATALIQAAKAGNLPMVHLLCRNGANWAHRSSGDNMSAFLQSVCLGYVDCAIYLLALGAEINEEGADGRRPLHYAAERGRTEVVRWLLSMGADKSAQAGSAGTAEALARENRHHDVVALLAPVT